MKIIFDIYNILNIIFNIKSKSIFLRKSSSLLMQVYIDEFEYIQKKIEFHYKFLKSQDINIAFLLSLRDSKT